MEQTLNGDLELPDALRAFVYPRYIGDTESILAAGQSLFEDNYSVAFPFDGRIIAAEATFVPSDEILIGTHLIREYRLEINFPTKTVVLERIAGVAGP